MNQRLVDAILEGIASDRTFAELVAEKYAGLLSDEEVATFLALDDEEQAS